MSIFATKTIEQIGAEQLGGADAGGLKRVLGPNQLILLGVGAFLRWAGDLRSGRR